MNFFKRVKQAAKRAMDASATLSFYRKHKGKKLTLADGGEGLISYTKTTTYNKAKSQEDEDSMIAIRRKLVASEIKIEMKNNDHRWEEAEHLESLNEQAIALLENGPKGDEEFQIEATVLLSGAFELMSASTDADASYGLSDFIDTYNEFMVFKVKVDQTLEDKSEDSVVTLTLPLGTSVKAEQTDSTVD